VYFAVSVIILVSGHFFPTNNEYITSIPILLSLLLIIPIIMWCRNSDEKTKISKEINGRNESAVLSWIFVLFILALSVRIPSVLLFDMPYEKTPLIYLIILTILALEKTDVRAFGFKMKNIGKSLLSGFLFFIILSGLAFLILHLLIYVFTGQISVQFYDVSPFLLTMPFMTLCVGVSEEGLFRGYMQGHLEKIYTFKRAVLIQAIFFGFWHFVWDIHPFNLGHMILYVGYTFLIGLLFGYFYSKTRNLIPLVVAHGLFNSVPQGIVVNQSAFNALNAVSLPCQILTWILPYVVSAVSAILFIRYLAREI